MRPKYPEANLEAARPNYSQCVRPARRRCDAIRRLADSIDRRGAYRRISNGDPLTAVSRC
jgi:hypothetical protein